MKRSGLIVLLLAVLYLLPSRVYSQYMEDALRLWQRNTPLTARAGALGFSYSGIADDAAALQINPAGLTLVPRIEAAAGGSFISHTITTSYTGLSQPSTLTAPALSQLAVIIPVRSHSNALTLGFSYSRDNHWHENSSVQSLSAAPSSIVQHWVKSQSGPDLSANRAWKLFLADTVGGIFVSPMKNGLRQTAFVQQRGGLHSFSAGAGVDIFPGLSVGAALMGKWGTYTYNRLYNEIDEWNIHNTLDQQNFSSIDIHNLQVQEEIQQTIGGVQMVVGIQAKIDDVMRLGVSVLTPTLYNIRENTSWLGKSTFDNGDLKSYQERGLSELSLITPWIFSAGISAHWSGLTVSAGAEYADGTDMQFQTLGEVNYISVSALQTLNVNLRQFLNNQVSWGIGAEYEMSSLPLVLRGSFSRSGSPYRLGDVQSATDMVGAGLGWYAFSNCRFDLTYRQAKVQTQTYLYPQPDAIYYETRSQHNVMLQIVVRW